MKKLFKNQRNKKIMMCVIAMALGMLMFCFPAFAAVNTADVMAKLISLMCSMFKYVGTAIFVWAIIQFILATKRSDADSKADAVQTAVCGVALMGIAAIITNLGVLDTKQKVSDTILDGSGSGTSTPQNQ